MAQTILPYVTFRSCRTHDSGMKKIFFDPDTLFTTSCESFPNLLEKYLCQTIVFSSLTRCLYSCANPVLGWMAEFVSSFLGYKIPSSVTVVM